MERSFRLLPERPGLVPWLKEQLKDAPPLIQPEMLAPKLRGLQVVRNPAGKADYKWATRVASNRTNP